MTDPSTGAFECRRADRGDCNCYEFDELADAIAARAEERGGEMSDPRRHVSIDYENYRGERRWRTIEPRRLEFENNEFHPETQWILYATDVERGVERGFALRDIHAWQPKSSP
jgi:hypothetical protein